MKKFSALAVAALLAIGCAEGAKTAPPPTTVDPAKMMEGMSTPMPGEAAPAADPAATPVEPAATPEEKPKEGEPTPAAPEKTE